MRPNAGSSRFVEDLRYCSRRRCSLWLPPGCVCVLGPGFSRPLFSFCVRYGLTPARIESSVCLPLSCLPLFRTRRYARVFLVVQLEESRAPQRVRTAPERPLPPHRLPLRKCLPRTRGSAAPTERCQKRYKLATLASIGSTLGSADAEMNRHVVDTRESRRRFCARLAGSWGSCARVGRHARDRDPDVCPAFVVVPDVCASPVRLRDDTDDREPETGASPGPRSVRTREALERT
jgi:hypothetical protein